MEQRHGLSLTILSFMLLGFSANPARAQMGGGCGMSHGGNHGSTQESDHMKSAVAPRAIPAPHGGAVHQTKEFQFETVYTENGVRLYFLAGDGAVLSAREIEGTVVFIPEKGKKTEVPLQWSPGNDDSMARYRVRPGAIVNQSAGFLWAPYDLRLASNGSVKAEIKLQNLGGEDENKAKWTESFLMTPLYGMACPMHPERASLAAGKCSICGGMDLQPAYVLYTCPTCGVVRHTTPGTCDKCDMDLKLRAVGGQETDATAMSIKSGQGPSKSVRANEQSQESPAIIYVCPMHSDVMSDSPGKCPKCGMDLVQKK